MVKISSYFLSDPISFQMTQFLFKMTWFLFKMTQFLFKMTLFLVCSSPSRRDHCCLLTAACWRTSGMWQHERYKMAPSNGVDLYCLSTRRRWTPATSWPSWTLHQVSRPPPSLTSPTWSAKGSEGSPSCWEPRSACCACTRVVRLSIMDPPPLPAWIKSWCFRQK